MSINNYSSLQSAIADWIKRDDLTARIPDFIQIGEARINRVSRLRDQESTATITTVADQAYNDLPVGFMGVLSLKYASADFESPTLVDISYIDEQLVLHAARPSHYALSDKIYYATKPDGVYSLTMRYHKKWDIATDDTNWLLTNNPDAYIYTALAAAGAFMKHPQTEQWKADAKSVIDEIEYSSNKAVGQAVLRADDGLQRPGNRFNILND